MPACPGAAGQVPRTRQLSRARSRPLWDAVLAARRPGCTPRRSPSHLSSFMHQLPGCPGVGGGETLVPPHRNLAGIIPAELFMDVKAIALKGTVRLLSPALRLKQR